MSIDRAYIRQELRRSAPACAPQNGETFCQFSVENYLRQGISSQQAEHLLTGESGGLKSWLIHVLFANKGALKRIPGLGNYLIRRKDQMLRERLESMSRRASIDLTDILDWYRDDFIAACYLRLLGRQPDAQGFGVYLDLSRRGADNQVIAYAIAQSAEFGNRAEVAHLQEYRRAYHAFMRKQKLLRVPVLGRVASVFLLSGQVERLYARVERTETACQCALQDLQRQAAEGAKHLAQTQGLVMAMQQGLVQQQKFLLDMRTQQQRQAAAVERALDRHSGQFGAMQRALEEQQDCLAQYAQEQLELSRRILQTIGEQSIYWQSTPAKLDDQSVLLGSLSQKLDSQAGVVGKISGQMDEMPLTLQAANKTSHSTVLGVPGGVIGVINDGFIFGVPSEDWPLAMYLSTGGTFERGSERFFEKQIRPQDTVLDIGANLGVYTLYALRKGCKVFSFEPMPRICSILKDNIHVNGYEVSGRSHVIEAAVSDVCGTAAFYQNKGVCGQCSSLYRAETNETVEEITVQTLTLDSCREQFGVVDFIKIDVEGAEYFAFCGMRRLLMENHNIKLIMEFAPAHMRRAGVEPEQMLSLIGELGFTIYQINEATAQAEPVEQSSLLQAQSVNLYLVRES